MIIAAFFSLSIASCSCFYSSRMVFMLYVLLQQKGVRAEKGVKKFQRINCHEFTKQLWGNVCPGLRKVLYEFQWDR